MVCIHAEEKVDMKKKKIITSIMCLLLTQLLIVSVVCPNVWAADISVNSDGDTITSKDYANNQPVMSQYSLYDASGNKVTIGKEVDSTTDIANLSKNLADGTMNASKNGCFANTQDAENGITKIDFDTVGKPVKSSEDVLFVLDESGSMNMLMDSNESLGAYKSLSPCLNEDHYYCIPVSCDFGNTQDIYFKLSDYGADAFSAWNVIPQSIFNQIKTDYGLHSDALGLSKWQPWNQHYIKNSDGTYTNVSKEYLTTNKYDSPVGNTNDCFDRMMMEKDQVKSFAVDFLNNRQNSREAVVGFSQDATTYTKNFTNSIDTIKSDLTNYVGHDHTNYTAGLENALDLIQNRTDKSRPAYVVFITDGKPEPSTNNGIDQAAALKALGSNIFAIGIRVGENDLLENDIASNHQYKSCDTVAEFTSALNRINQNLSGNPTGTVTDTIGADYSLVVDADYPITIGGKAYTSLDSLPESINYDATTKTFTWTQAASEEGSRLSFYEQLDASKRSSAAATGSYDTNGSASLTYHKLTKDDSGKIVTDPETTTIPLDTPKIQTQGSTFPASVVSNRMTNNDPDQMGQTVTNGDEITYTITLKNDGTTDAKNLVIRNPIPQYTEFVSAQNDGVYSSDNNYITWEIPEIKAGESVQVSFTTKVTADVTDQTADIIPEGFTWGWGTAADYTTQNPPCVGNQLQNPTPVPITAANILGSSTINTGINGPEWEYGAAALVLRVTSTTSLKNK
jgi:uncharacterized repeat protein (TIGR01451 family)